jgi:hypothetical protein
MSANPIANGGYYAGTWRCPMFANFANRSEEAWRDAAARNVTTLG